MIQRYTVILNGRVQGVSFREFAKTKADEFGVVGFVCNQSDGSLFIDAQGEKEQLREFMAACQKGPRLALLSKVEFHEEEPVHFSSFEIR